MSSLFQLKPVLKFTAIFCGIFLLSYLGYLFPILNAIIFWIIIIGTAILSFRKLEYGVLVVLSELFLGGRGYLFSFNFFSFVVSLRLALFVLVFLIWFFFYRSYDKYKFAKLNFFLPFAILTLFIALGVARGIYLGHSARNIFFDANGYLYLAFIFPLFDAIYRQFIEKLLRALIAAAIALSILTVFMGFGFSLLHPEVRSGKSGILSYEFEKEEKTASEISHSVTAKDELKNFSLRRDMSDQKQSEYRWTKDTGMGELAIISGYFFRFFSASQIYLVIAFALLLFSFKDQFANQQNIKKYTVFRSAVLCLILAAILIGFSRSIWFGTAAIFLFFLFTLPKKYSFKIILMFLGVVGIFIILTNTFAPKIYDTVADRIWTVFNPQTQSTALTRINIFNSAADQIKKHVIFGSGFGSIITYESVIPGASGILKVFTYEWQYLEILQKMGLAGLWAYLWLLFTIFYQYTKIDKEKNKTIAQALIAGLIGFLILNITTPYLNHPLGIGFLIIMVGVIENFKTNKK